MLAWKQMQDNVRYGVLFPVKEAAYVAVKTSLAVRQKYLLHRSEGVREAYG